MVTFKEFEEVWDESRFLSDLVKVLSSAERHKPIEVRVYKKINMIDVSPSVKLYEDDKEDMIDFLKKIMARKLSRLKEQGFDFYEEYQKTEDTDKNER